MASNIRYSAPLAESQSAYHNAISEPLPEHLITALKRAKEICQKNSVRLTELREQVLTLILLHGKPLGAYTLMDLLEASSDRERVAPPTIYRTLDFLLEYRLIHKVHSLNAYVANANPKRQESSVILICSDCGIAEEIPNNTIQQAINLSASQHRFAVTEQVIEITGHCSACKGQTTNGPKGQNNAKQSTLK